MGFQLQNRDKIRSIDQGFVFGEIIVAKEPFVSALGEIVDSCLYLRLHSEGDNTTCGISVQTSAQGIQKFVENRRGAHALTVS